MEGRMDGWMDDKPVILSSYTHIRTYAHSRAHARSSASDRQLWPVVEPLLQFIAHIGWYCCLPCTRALGLLLSA